MIGFFFRSMSCALTGAFLSSASTAAIVFKSNAVAAGEEKGSEGQAGAKGTPLDARQRAP